MSATSDRSGSSKSPVSGGERLDPLAAAKLRGAKLKREFIEVGGGLFSGEEAASLLRVRMETLDAKREAGMLIAIKQDGEFFYPRFQFDQAGTIPNLEQVLKALEAHDVWMKIAFFLNPNVWLEGKSALTMLKEGKTEAVLIAAEMYGEQGGA